MSKRKNHHYVPRFYLKRFSINNEGKVIGLYNIKSKIFVQNAPIKHQACEAFLYGRDDEIEALLAGLESSIAMLFHYWTDKKILIPPPEGTNGLIALKRFILYQLFRTPKAGENVSEHLNQAFHSVMKVLHPGEINEDDRLVHEDPVLLALINAMDKESLLNFLKCKFIVNLSPLSFISSDAPVIMYNQLMEEIGVYTGATSLVAKGLQIFYPIHPRLMICLYDNQVYDCTDNDKSNDFVSTELIEDIHQLNALQYINSNSQLFFNETIDRSYSEYFEEQYNNKRDEPRSINQMGKTNDNRYLLFSSFEDAHIQLKLSFFEIIYNLKNFKPEISSLRHPSLRRD